MKHKSYLDAIDSKIKEAQAQLNRLLDARAVVLEVSGMVQPVAPKPDTSITIKKVLPVHTEAVKRKPKTDRKTDMNAAKELQDWITKELEALPQTSSDLILSRFGRNATSQEKQKIYAGLYYMQQKGLAKRDADRTYILNTRAGTRTDEGHKGGDKLHAEPEHESRPH